MFVIKRLVAAGAAAVLLGCAAEGPTEPSLKVTGLHGSPVARPAGGRCQTTFEFLAPEAEQPPNVQRIRILLNCNLRHLGLTSGEATQTLTFTGPTTMNLVNSSTYTAANGDELYAEFIGTGTLDPVALSVTFEGTETYLGGTGRFEGATGSSALAGSASLISSSGFYQTTGSITF